MTSRVKKDGKEDEKVPGQKYKWDEENRLLAADVEKDGQLVLFETELSLPHVKRWHVQAGSIGFMLHNDAIYEW